MPTSGLRPQQIPIHPLDLPQLNGAILEGPLTARHKFIELGIAPLQQHFSSRSLREKGILAFFEAAFSVGKRWEQPKNEQMWHSQNMVYVVWWFIPEWESGISYVKSCQIVMNVDDHGKHVSVSHIKCESSSFRLRSCCWIFGHPFNQCLQRYPLVI